MSRLWIIMAFTLILAQMALPVAGQRTVIVKPGDDLASVIQELNSGCIVRFMPGNYYLNDPLRITIPQTTLTSDLPQSAFLMPAKTFSGGALLHITAPDVTINNLVFDGQFLDGVRGLRGAANRESPERAANRLVVDNCRFTRLTRHAIDIDGDDSIVRKTSVNKILWNLNGERKDAHGIVTKHARSLRIENVDIHQCSGDAFQADRGSWNDVWIVGSHLWDSPLEADSAGFRKGTLVSENAIDTKHRFKDRGRLAVVGCRINGFRSNLINNVSALNLKENVDVVVDGCEVYDSNIAFRLRGRSKGMAMRSALINCVVRNNDTAYRIEDKLQNFRMFFCTMMDNQAAVEWAPDYKTWFRSYYDWQPQGWSNVNNLWIGRFRLPEISSSKELGAANNRTMNRRSISSEFIPMKGITAVDEPPLMDTWYEPSGRVVRDQKGKTRKKPSTVGAFEVYK